MTKSLSDIKQLAQEMGVPVKYALQCRKRYLLSLLEQLDSEIEASLALVDGESEAMDRYLLNDTWRLIDESIKVIMKIKVIERESKELAQPKDQITDEMIERARSTPIETILEFTRGKIRCIDPDHDDKHPSAYYGRRTNRLFCPVCNKSWDALACYQYMFGCDFKTAVKALQ